MGKGNFKIEMSFSDSEDAELRLFRALGMLVNEKDLLKNNINTYDYTKHGEDFSRAVE